MVSLVYRKGQEKGFTMTDFQAKYNELVERYAKWDRSYEPYPMTVTALFYELTDGQIEFDGFEINTQWGLYYFGLDGTFEDYSIHDWQNDD